MKVNKVSVTVADNWGNGGKKFTRTIPFDKLTAIMSKADVDARRAAGELVESADGVGFFVRDSAPADRPTYQPPARTKFDDLADRLDAGVKVVAAPHLFPTPPELPRRVVELAEIRDGHTVLEPSAGTGNLIRAVRAVAPNARVEAVEISPALAGGLSGVATSVRCADFLACNGELGRFDRIVMNPPFDHGADIEHIRHAYGKLAPGGRLVAICANGPRQQEELGEICTQWIPLPADSFKDQGTGVRTAFVVIDA